MPDTLPVDVPELTFPSGLPGFDDLRRFALSQWGGQDSPYARLVSLDQPDTAFLVAPPEAFFDDYEVPLDPDDAARLQLQSTADALVLVVITVGEKAEEASANLLGPLVINTRARLGAQVVLADPDQARSTRTPLRAA